MRLRWWKTYEEKCDLVLSFLAEHGESGGLAICKGTGIGQGTIYVLLMRMENEGLVRSRYELGPIDSRIGLRRRLYRPGPSSGKRARVETFYGEPAWGLP